MGYPGPEQSMKNAASERVGKCMAFLRTTKETGVPGAHLVKGKIVGDDVPDIMGN